MAKSSDQCPVPSGMLLIIGGKESKGEDPQNHEKPGNYVAMEVLKTFAELIENKNGEVEIVTTATSDGKETFAEYKKAFKEAGISKLNHLHHKERKDALAEAKLLIERINNAAGIFFTGGDQMLLTAIYGGTQFLTTLKERYINKNLVIAGTSAGAMALSTPMIYAGRKEVEHLNGEIKVTTGLEFMKDVCIDTHFVHRGRFVRMAQVIATNPTCIGAGVDEDTAWIVRNGTETEVIGSGLVTVLEGYDISLANTDDHDIKAPISIRDLRVHLLAKGDKYRIMQRNPPHY
jgi:cyanophycinase